MTFNDMVQRQRQSLISKGSDDADKLFDILIKLNHLPENHKNRINKLLTENPPHSIEDILKILDGYMKNTYKDYNGYY